LLKTVSYLVYGVLSYFYITTKNKDVD